MGILSGLKPEKVFTYFEEIARIPHGSGNVGAISDYLAGFARERGLQYIQDEVKNVIIIKEATPGYEQEPALAPPAQLVKKIPSSSESRFSSL